MGSNLVLLPMVAVPLSAVLAVAATASQRADAGEVAVAAAQTELRFYRTAAEFERHMEQRIAAAAAHRPDLIVLPEDIGTPLIALGETETLAGVGSLKEAAERLAARHRAAVAEQCARRGVSPQRALWLIKADTIRRAYRATFSALARRHRVHILAGTAPLVFRERPSDVFNAAALFSPTGAMRVVARKVRLVDLEQAGGLDLTPGGPEDQRTFRVGGVTFGPIVCADGWDQDLARRLADRGAQVLVQTSANPEVWTEEVRDGWKESLFSRVQELQVYGVLCMGAGKLLDLTFQGQSQILAPRAWTPDGTGVLAQARSAMDEEVVTARLPIRSPWSASR